MKIILMLLIFFVCFEGLTTGQDAQLPIYLQDRGTGIPTSMFGTYVRKGELLFYPFFEYYHDHDFEYSPAELGFESQDEFRGKFRASEGLVFVSYGFNDWMAAEFEASIITASLEKAPEDGSNLPVKLKESGLGDVEGQVRFRLLQEKQSHPEVYSFLEISTPTQKHKVLIGTQDWEYTFGMGFTKGFSWGTLTLRGAGEYSRFEQNLEGGEYAVEYLKRLSSKWRIYLGIEGSQGDEVELITEAQWHITDSIFIKMNNGFGITSKATDWAPEIGVMFSFR
jgi:hypothetical protein